MYYLGGTYMSQFLYIFFQNYSFGYLLEEGVILTNCKKRNKLVLSSKI